MPAPFRTAAIDLSTRHALARGTSVHNAMAAMRLVMAASILLLAECRSMVRREATPKVQLDEDRGRWAIRKVEDARDQPWLS